MTEFFQNLVLPVSPYLVTALTIYFSNLLPLVPKIISLFVTAKPPESPQLQPWDEWREAAESRF